MLIREFRILETEFMPRLLPTYRDPSECYQVRRIELQDKIRFESATYPCDAEKAQPRN